MSIKVVFLLRAFSLTYEAGRRHIAATAVVAVFFFAMPILVQSPANIENILPVAWAQSAIQEGQNSVPVGEEGVASGGELETAQAEKQEQEEQLEEQEEQEDQEEQTIIDRIHRALSAGISNTAGAVDGFFDDERHADEVNRTRVKLRFDTFFERGEEVEFKFRLNLSLVIPKTKKRIKVFVSGNPERDEAGEVGGTPETTEEEDLDVAVAYTPIQTVSTNFSMRTGIKLKSSTAAWWIGPRWRGYYEGEIWGTRLTQTFRWRTDDGFESISTFDLERDIAENLFYRTTLKGRWNQDNEDYRYDITPQVFQRLDPNRVLRYLHSTKFNSNTENQFDEFLFRFTYRQRIWRK